MELTAKKRTELGKKSKKIRKEGKLPAVVFAKDTPSIPLTVDYLKFERIYTASGESTLIDLSIDNEKPFKVLVSEVSYHPVTDKINHVNFHKVNLKEKISATVPIEIVGESPIVKAGEGILLTLIHEITVESLPTDLPHDIKVDVSGLLEIGQGIHIKDLPVDLSKVEILDQDPLDLVVKIDYAEMKEEVVEAPVTEEELVAKVEATEQLTEEEKATREKEKKEVKEKEEKE
ncbi:hypothetical protein A2716_02765 [candidate division WWE3 bacterium RIFCSPHIGHO2_01_FULL_40_23]|uniref:Large ribosomal subunit protein bL25 n=1 Tax=candidate division WWE3 bacterium RIFCSPLOWO2_01_FULL_41_18 TaxID=1802625 RepID=A0A1F4VFD4_UNCKA|nr:MAG: hypothetical protein A2716_02765 [candidate division WWE3 bacterium RIFCSPHIGHO2_01_FULL_40_23]OGC55907.1 MAG: hypothetical protein A3A78_02615 [candidate division WWE3 bacterium RIFCSPLOWO2_01_FULL_41_18]